MCSVTARAGGRSAKCRAPSTSMRSRVRVRVTRDSEAEADEGWRAAAARASGPRLGRPHSCAQRPRRRRRRLASPLAPAASDIDGAAAPPRAGAAPGRASGGAASLHTRSRALWRWLPPAAA